MTLWAKRAALKGLALAIGVGLLTFTAFSGKGFAIHKGAGDLVCGNCHTMHNSQGGQGLGGLADGSLILLRGPVNSRSEIHKFCLQCHASNGAQAATQHAPQNVQAPKVWSTATWTDNDAFNMIGSGGNFSTELNSSWDAATSNMLGYGHSLGATTVTPPGGDMPIEAFSCTSCHDPHGTSNPADTKINLFRNLRVNATGASDHSGVRFISDTSKPWREHRSYVGGVNGTYFGGTEKDNANNVIWPVFRGSLSGDPVADSANSNSYGTGNDLEDYPHVATMSKWCAQCHDKWHEKYEATNYVGFSGNNQGPDWRRHPVNGMMPRKAGDGCAGSCHTSLNDRRTYSLSLIQAGKGIPVTTSKYYSGYVYYLPYEAPCTPGSITCMDTPNQEDNHKVFCLSCHFAHGGPYYDNLRWNYATNVDTGTQTGNGVPSNKGCQLCHNRGG